MSKNFLILDVECSGATKNKANPYDPENKLCCIGLGHAGKGDEKTLPVEYGEEPYGNALAEVQAAVDECDLLITYTKYDLHWLRRYGIKFIHKPYYDAQLVEFILTGQKKALPSLNECLEERGLELKKDIVKEEYWKKGIDTPDVPWEILSEYCSWDVRQEGELVLKQMVDISANPSMRRLVWNSCQDELATQEMEWNGLHYDMDKSLAYADALEQEVLAIDKRLADLFPYPFLNWASTEHVSAILYGGEIVYDVREPVLFTYKDGRTIYKDRWMEKTQQFPRLVEPIPNTKLKKEGYFATNEGVLPKLKTSGLSRIIVDSLLERRRLEKRIGTWYRGFPKKYQFYNWQDNLLHTNLNHAVAGTGRMASSNPNVQNIEDMVRRCLTTRFKTIRK